MPSEPVYLSENPKIYYVDEMLTTDECQHIIKEATPHLKLAGVSVMPGQKGFEKGVYKGRTNRSAWIEKVHSPQIHAIVQRIADQIGCDRDHFESLQVIHYEPGQEYKYHFDGYDFREKAKYQKFCGQRGNRLRTVLVYMNHVEEGGETGFNQAKPLGEVIKVTPETGRMIVFDNLLEDGSLNRRSRHAGLPIIKGEKWAFNLWLRERS
jgi:prolyl 4-hydroxylase